LGTHLTGGSHLSAIGREEKLEWAGGKGNGPSEKTGPAGEEKRKQAGGERKKKRRKGRWTWAEREGSSFGLRKKKEKVIEGGFGTLNFCFVFLNHITTNKNQCKGIYASNHLVNSKFKYFLI
jgi:hypothetical protein